MVDLNAVLDGADAAAELTWRTLADISDAPPDPLQFGLLEESQNLLVAPPGTGKGMIGAHLVCQAMSVGMVPLIYDAERRGQEWARRVGGFGGDRSKVVYVTPEDLPRNLRGQPIWEAAAHLHRLVCAAGVDFQIVDSALPAVAMSEDAIRSDPSVPWQFVEALKHIGPMTLTFAHPPKAQPDGDAFGSYAWKAAHRIQWNGRQAEGEGHRIRLRNRKANERGRVPGLLLEVTYDDAGIPVGLTQRNDDENTRELILEALAAGPQTAAAIVERILEDEDEIDDAMERTTSDRVGRMLRRMKREELVDGPPQGARNAVWTLRQGRNRVLSGNRPK